MPKEDLKILIALSDLIFRYETGDSFIGPDSRKYIFENDNV
ncbi:MAG: hypothetical protein PF638_06675 [Candidatus Delongbacteria bacterium]|jgi:hypothetical protein|nr:hypothetical protein [Candidatus Delongbacteria bacterium]